MLSSTLDDAARRFSTAVVFIEVEGKLLAIRSPYKPYWTVPGGMVDPRETPKQCAIREVFEETGIQLAADISFVAVISRHSKTAETYQFVFRAQISQSALQNVRLQENEVDAYTLFNRDVILQGNEPYAKALYHWANGVTGYIEQDFEGENTNGE